MNRTQLTISIFVFMMPFKKLNAKAECEKRHICGTFTVKDVQKAQVSCLDYDKTEEWKKSHKSYVDLDECVLDLESIDKKKVYRVFVDKKKCSYKKGQKIEIAFTGAITDILDIGCADTEPRKLIVDPKTIGGSVKAYHTAGNENGAFIDLDYKDPK